MKFLAVEKELAGIKYADHDILLKAEARAVWELQQSGKLREIYFHADLHTAVLMLECIGVEEARRELTSLPLAAAGLVQFDVIPLVP
jgi:hypothetical protein